MVKIRRKFDWKEILGDQAWTAQELADKLGMHILTLRRYLRFAVNGRKLVMRKFGRYQYYVCKDVWIHYLRKKRGLKPKSKPD